MSGASSSVAGWYSRLEPAPVPNYPKRPDDPRLGEVVEFWNGDRASLRAGRPVLVGFPQDEGIRRNLGRPGAAAAPDAIRSCLWRLTPYDPSSDTDLTQTPLLDAGNVRAVGALEETQVALGEVIAGILAAEAIPVVLGGGHETAYGHFLGYVNAGLPVGIINFDAHLDVRPCLGSLGHAGSPFRQAMEHPTRPLAPHRYLCLGAQPSSVGRQHARFVLERGGRIGWADAVRSRLSEAFADELRRLTDDQCHIYVTLDADVIHEADVPAVSAPNPNGLGGADLFGCLRLAGQSR